VEIERLQTTCFSLNNKASAADDLKNDIKVLQRRLADSEKIR